MSRRPDLCTVEVAGVRVRYLDTGEGPAVIMAHCSSASHREWTTLVARLSPGYRVLAPDLIGYGRSDPWPAGRVFDPRADVEILIRLAEGVGKPVHLVGHSYGGAMALEAARSLGDGVASLSLVEPVSFHVLRLAGRGPEWRTVMKVARRVSAAVRSGRPRRGARIYMGFWIGRIRWALTPRKVRDRVVASMGKVAREFESVEGVETPLAAYTAISAPVRLFVGEATRRPARAVVEVLASVLPQASVTEIPGAGHMSPFTHADLLIPEIASAIKAAARAGGGS